MPSDSVLSAPKDRRIMSLDDYKTEITMRCADTWKLAQEQIKKSQASQKLHYDASASEPNIREGTGFMYIHLPESLELHINLFVHLLDHT